MASVSIRHLGMDVPSRAPKAAAITLLGDVSLEIADGEFLVLVGPSGCGKTTLLRCIAGLETITRGELCFDGVRVNEVSPAARDIAMVFQSYALYPHLTVRENLAFGLRMRKTPKAEIKRRVDEVAAMLELGGLLDSRPARLSGGQRQRVAMGRAVVRHPRVFLFDEPLSNLDASLRGQLRVELKRLHARLGATMIYVTHDQVEAMTLADRIAVLRKGALEQVGTPRALYERPQNRFVAGFIGTPEMNFVDGELEDGGFRADPVKVSLCANFRSGKATLGIRPEDIAVSPASDGGTASDARGIVDVIENLGWESLVHVSVGERALAARVETAKAPRTGDRVELTFARDRIHLFDPSERRIEPLPGAENASPQAKRELAG